MYTQIYIYIYMYIDVSRLDLAILKWICKYMYLHMYMYIYVYVCTCMFINSCGAELSLRLLAHTVCSGPGTWTLRVLPNPRTESRRVTPRNEVTQVAAWEPKHLCAVFYKKLEPTCKMIFVDVTSVGLGLEDGHVPTFQLLLYKELFSKQQSLEGWSP